MSIKQHNSSPKCDRHGAGLISPLFLLRLANSLISLIKDIVDQEDSVYGEDEVVLSAQGRLTKRKTRFNRLCRPLPLWAHHPPNHVFFVSSPHFRHNLATISPQSSQSWQHHVFFKAIAFFLPHSCHNHHHCVKIKAIMSFSRQMWQNQGTALILPEFCHNVATIAKCGAIRAKLWFFIFCCADVAFRPHQHCC